MRSDGEESPGVGGIEETRSFSREFIERQDALMAWCMEAAPTSSVAIMNIACASRRFSYVAQELDQETYDETMQRLDEVGIHVHDGDKKADGDPGGVSGKTGQAGPPDSA